MHPSFDLVSYLFFVETFPSLGCLDNVTGSCCYTITVVPLSQSPCFSVLPFFLSLSLSLSLVISSRPIVLDTCQMLMSPKCICSDLSSVFQPHISYQLHSMASWISNRHLKFNTPPAMELLMPGLSPFSLPLPKCTPPHLSKWPHDTPRPEEVAFTLDPVLLVSHI